MFRTISQCFKIIVILLSLSVSTRSVAADHDIERIKRDVITSWIADVDGEARTRTLNIRGAERKQDGVWVLDATYGWTDGGQSAVRAELTVKSDGYRLELTTQAESLISAESLGVGEFSGPFMGTFKWKSGVERPVKLVRVSDAVRMSSNAPQTPCNANATLDSSVGSDVHDSTVERPRLSVGDCWVFRTTNLWKNEETEVYEYRIMAVNKDEVALEGKIISSINAKAVGTKWGRTAQAAIGPPVVREFRVVAGKYVAFQFPLQIGKTWEYEYKTVDSDGEMVRRVTANVQGWDNIVTPVGKVRALKVMHSGSWFRPAMSNRFTEILWYVPEVKWWVRREYQSYDAKGALYNQFRTELVRVGVKQQ